MRYPSARRSLIGPLFGLCLLGLGSPAWASTWNQTAAKVKFTMVHKFHQVEGVSEQVTVRMLYDGKSLKVMAQAPVASFKTGNSSRDAHMLEVVNAVLFPTVSLRALAPELTPPEVGQSASLQLQGEVELHGIRTRVPLKVLCRRLQADQVSIEVTFSDSLTAHQIERPQLLFVPVDDALQLQAQISLQEVP